MRHGLIRTVGSAGGYIHGLSDMIWRVVETILAWLAFASQALAWY